VDPAENVLCFHNFQTGEKIFDYQMKDEKLREITIAGQAIRIISSIILLILIPKAILLTFYSMYRIYNLLYDINLIGLKSSIILIRF